MEMLGGRWMMESGWSVSLRGAVAGFAVCRRWVREVRPCQSLCVCFWQSLVPVIESKPCACGVQHRWQTRVVPEDTQAFLFGTAGAESMGAV